MKKKFLGIGLSLAMSLTLMTSTVFATSTTSPGSASDPVVSKSYVDALIGGVLEDILNLQKLIQELTTEVEAIKTTVLNNTNTNETNTETPTTLNYSYKPLELQKNQLLIGGEGTEIIVRSGGAIAYSESVNGLSNVSTGIEVMNGEPITLNNVLVVSRADNRGILVTVDATWILIRGDYTIINN